MSATLSKLPPLPSGTSPIFQWARRIHKCIEERTCLGVRGGSVDRKLNGFVVNPADVPGVSGGAIDIGFFQIVSYTDEELTCNRVTFRDDGVEVIDPENTTVQKPYGLRSGNSYSGTISAGGSSTADTYTLDPVYSVGGRVIAALMDDGNWWDLNIDARHYILPLTRIVVCSTVNGQTVKQYMLVRGTAPFGTAP